MRTSRPPAMVIPEFVVDLPSFRRWARSDAFPESGRIDWLAGQLEVDMSPEDLFTHGTLETAIARRLEERVLDSGRGVVFVDSTRLSNRDADLSVEPDVVVLLRETIDAGRATFVPKANRAEGRYVELEGAVDLIVECVSDSSVRKDGDRLPALYHAAGVREYWIADARGDAPTLRVLRWAPGEYTEADRSGLLDAEVAIERVDVGSGLTGYRLLLA